MAGRNQWGSSCDLCTFMVSQVVSDMRMTEQAGSKYVHSGGLNPDN